MSKVLFCTNRECPNNRLKEDGKGWYTSWGSYKTLVRGTIRRYRCRICGKTFSDQTFSLDYAVKKTVDYRMLEDNLKTGSGIRDMGRVLGVSTTTILNRLERLSRQALGVMSELYPFLPGEKEYAADGFESFVSSQYHPCHITLLAGGKSQYVYGAAPVVLRRKGRMTEKQRVRREELEKQWRAPRQGVSQSFAAVCGSLLPLLAKSSSPKLLFTDEHPAYVRAYNLLPELLKALREHKLFHFRISSKAPRTRFNPLFAVNYLDRQFRKDQASHCRETVQFSRSINDMMNRMMIYLAYHNTEKIYRIRLKRGDPATHGEAAGLSSNTISRVKEGYYRNRKCYSLLQLKDWEQRTWLRLWVNPMDSPSRPVPAYALL